MPWSCDFEAFSNKTNTVEVRLFYVQTLIEIFRSFPTKQNKLKTIEVQKRLYSSIQIFVLSKLQRIVVFLDSEQ